MKLGNKYFFFIFFLFFTHVFCFALVKIISSELINLDKIKPSFEEIEESNNNNSESEIIKNKKKVI